MQPLSFLTAVVGDQGGADGGTPKVQRTGSDVIVAANSTKFMIPAGEQNQTLEIQTVNDARPIAEAITAALSKPVKALVKPTAPLTKAIAVIRGSGCCSTATLPGSDREVGVGPAAAIEGVLGAAKAAFDDEGETFVDIAAYTVGPEEVHDAQTESVLNVIARCSSLGAWPPQAAYARNGDKEALNNVAASLRSLYPSQPWDSAFFVDALVSRKASSSGEEDRAVARIAAVWIPNALADTLDSICTAPYRVRSAPLARLLDGVFGGHWETTVVAALGADGDSVAAASILRLVTESLESMKNKGPQAECGPSLRKMGCDWRAALLGANDDAAKATADAAIHFFEGLLHGCTFSSAQQRDTTSPHPAPRPGTPQSRAQQQSEWRRNNGRSPSDSPAPTSASRRSPSSVANSPSDEARTLRVRLQERENDVVEFAGSLAAKEEALHVQTNMLRDAKSELATFRESDAQLRAEVDRLDLQVVALRTQVMDEESRRVAAETEASKVPELQESNAALSERVRVLESYSPAPPKRNDESPNGGPVMPETQRDSRQRAKIAELESEVSSTTVKANLLEARVTELEATLAGRESTITTLMEQLAAAREELKQRDETKKAPTATEPVPTRVRSPATFQRQTSAPRKAQPAASTTAVPPINRSYKRADTPTKIVGVTPRTATRVEPVTQEARTRPAPATTTTGSASSRQASPGAPFRRTVTPVMTSSSHLSRQPSSTRTPTASTARPASTSAARPSSVTRSSTGTVASATSRPVPRVASPAKTRTSTTLASAGFMNTTSAQTARKAQVAATSQVTARHASPTTQLRIQQKMDERAGLRRPGQANEVDTAPRGTAIRSDRQTAAVRPVLTLRPTTVTPLRSTEALIVGSKYPTTFRPTRMVRHQQWEEPGDVARR